MPADVVQKLFCDWVVEHAVDGEVAARHIVARVGGVAHRIRAAAVRVRAIGAEGGDLGFELGFRVVGVRRDHKHHAEMRAHGKCARKHVEDDLGRGAGGDVEVLGLAPKQAVAHAAAGVEGLVARGAERLNDRKGGLFGLGACGHTSDWRRFGGSWNHLDALRREA